MCGITGFYTKNTSQARAALFVTCKSMVETIGHRGPDSDGVWQDPDLGMVIGHARLSIIDLSEEGAQPMVSASDRYVLSYNGEIYNFPEMQKELEANGVTFRGRSDTEVILAGIDFWGLNLTLQKMNGMFAFALWDRKNRQLHLCRDRLGKKPLYVGWAGDTLVFGSELKALRAHPDFKAEIDPAAMSAFMRYSAVPAPACIYKGIWSLPAAHILSLDVENLSPNSTLTTEMKPYWHHMEKMVEAREHMGNAATDESVIEDFETLLTQCVQERMVSDVPLGALLSGGIDSSAIVALMQNISNQPIKTYSVGFSESGFNEAEYAKKVAAHISTDHHELYLNEGDALATIPMLPDIYDEPFGDISAIPTYLVSKFARQDVSVVLSGDGGDEMLGGYNRHITGPKIWTRTRHLPSFIRNNLANIVQKISVEQWNSINKKQPQFGTRMHKAASVLSLDTQDAIYERLISAWQNPPTHSDLTAPSMRDLSEYSAPDTLSFAEKMMYYDALGYLPNDILTKVDRASMAVSLECRAPLLDKRIYEHVWRLPEKYKIRGAQGKWLLRQVLHRHVPKTLFERPKQGFTMPVGSWLRGELKDWAAALLDKDKLEADGLLDASILHQRWDEHQKGEGNHTERLWNVLMFQAWKDRWM